MFDKSSCIIYHVIEGDDKKKYDPFQQNKYYYL